jgi:hypothetical protein
MAGAPAEYSEHLRLWTDGKLQGYHLLMEQPNKEFIARQGRSSGGNLYKLIWFGKGIVGQHEKKTNLGTGHDDLIAVIHRLGQLSGAAQWEFIQRNFDVTNFVNYYVVNFCIQNWDGFFNNYFTYHDTEGNGQWAIYPWDEDKTWGDYDGASSKYDWYTMPLTFGMNGDQEPGGWVFRRGAPWWRGPGYFSGPLLANPEFRARLLARLREVCEGIFTEKQMFSIIDALEKRLADEVPLRARALGQDSAVALAEFHADIQSFRNQVTNRRKFILNELIKK